MPGHHDLPTHHIPDVVLMDYAAGNVHEALSLLVASHLALCPSCREELCEIELIGGALLEDVEDEGGAVAAALPESLTDLLTRGRPPVAPAAGGGGAGPLLPRPLADYVGDDLAALAWRTAYRGVQEFVLGTGQHGIKSSLLRIEPGRQMPRHTHMGDEYTLVLQGGFSDQAGRYLRGDVAVADDSVTHRPTADDHEVCVCLTATDAPLQLTGPIGWLVNPFLRR